MIKSRHFRNTVVSGLLVLFAVVGVWAESPAKSPGDELLAIIPAGSLFCVRVNNFDYTISQIDQFLTGVSPLPMGVSMMARMQLAGVFGDAELKGIRMGGNFAVFGVMVNDSASAASPTSNMLIAGLIPITDYKQFIDGNPNCSEADDKGISKITTKDMTGQSKVMLITQVGNYALVSPPDNYDKLAVTAKSITDNKTSGLGGVLDAAEAKLAMKEPLWAYGNIQQASKTFGPVVFGQLEKMKTAMEQGMELSGQGGSEQVETVVNMYAGILETLMKETKSLSIALNPRPNVLNITKTISALPGTDMADMFVAGSPAGHRNKLLGYLDNGAAMNVSGKITGKLNAKAMDFFATIISKDMTTEDVAKIKALAADIAKVFSGNDAMTFSIDPKTRPPFAIKYVIEVEDADKFNKVIEEATEMFNSEGGIADFYKSLGMEISCMITKGTGSHKSVSINSAKFVVKSTNPNSPQGQMISQMYGNELNYRWAIVDGLWVCAVGGDVNSTIRERIDTVKAGGPKQMASEISAALALLPDAEGADFMGTYNYLRLFKIAGMMMPVPIPEMDIATKSNIAFAGKIGGGKLTVDIALPKEHLMEFMTAFQTMQQKMAKQQSQEMPMPEQAAASQPPAVQAQPKIERELGTLEVEPMVGISGVRFGMTVEQIKEILGQPQNVTGHTYQYFDTGLVITTTSDKTVDAIFCGAIGKADSPLIRNCKYRTSKNIGMGSSKEDVISAYGQPTSTHKPPGKSHTATLEYESINSKFTIRDGKVVHMIFRRPR